MISMLIKPDKTSSPTGNPGDICRVILITRLKWVFAFVKQVYIRITVMFYNRIHKFFFLKKALCDVANIP